MNITTLPFRYTVELNELLNNMDIDYEELRKIRKEDIEEHKIKSRPDDNHKKLYQLFTKLLKTYFSTKETKTEYSISINDNPNIPVVKDEKLKETYENIDYKIDINTINKNFVFSYLQNKKNNTAEKQILSYLCGIPFRKLTDNEVKIIINNLFLPFQTHINRLKSLLEEKLLDIEFILNVKGYDPDVQEKILNNFNQINNIIPDEIKHIKNQYNIQTISKSRSKIEKIYDDTHNLLNIVNIKEENIKIENITNTETYKLLTEIRNIKCKINELKQKKENKNKRIRELKKKNQELESRINGLKKNNDENSNQEHNLTQLYEKLNKHIKSISKLQEEYNRTTDNIDTELSLLNKKSTVFENSYEKLSSIDRAKLIFFIYNKHKSEVINMYKDMVLLIEIKNNLNLQEQINEIVKKIKDKKNYSELFKMSNDNLVSFLTQHLTLTERILWLLKNGPWDFVIKKRKKNKDYELGNIEYIKNLLDTPYQTIYNKLFEKGRDRNQGVIVEYKKYINSYYPVIKEEL
ncbi:MAG: hypothetical protein ACOCUI_00465 [bacterium]